MADASTKALRIGLRAEADDSSTPWRARLAQTLAAEPGLAVTHLALGDDKAKETREGRLFSAFFALDKALFARRRAASSLSALFPEARRTEPGATPPVEGPDLWLVLDGRSPPALTAAAPLGALVIDSYGNGSAGEAAGAARALAAPGEMLDIRLVHLSGDDNACATGCEIARARCARRFSIARTVAAGAEKLPALVMRELRRLARAHASGGSSAAIEGAFEGVVTNAERSVAEKRSDVLAYAAMFAGGAAGRLAREAGGGLRRRLGRDAPSFSLYFGRGDVLAADFAQTRAAPVEKSAFHADPFFFRHNGVAYVFYEHYCQHTKLGRIRVARLDDDRFTVLGDALSTPYHLSFPFVFEHENEIFMLPETQAQRRLEIWRARAFPLSWELHATALEGEAAVDSSILNHSGAWFLFTNIARGAYPDHTTALDIYRADGPMLRTLIPHKENPVVADVSCGRNAGRVFSAGGGLIRPAQDNSKNVYGYALRLMEITRLDDEGYEERPLRTIVGSHHVDVCGDRFVFDGRPGAPFGSLGMMQP